MTVTVQRAAALSIRKPGLLPQKGGYYATPASFSVIFLVFEYLSDISHQTKTESLRVYFVWDTIIWPRVYYNKPQQPSIADKCAVQKCGFSHFSISGKLLLYSAHFMAILTDVKCETMNCSVH